MKACIAILIEIALFDDVVVGLVNGIYHVLGSAANGFVALYEHAIVAGIGDVYAIEMPIAAAESNTLVWVVGMAMIGHA